MDYYVKYMSVVDRGDVPDEDDASNLEIWEQESVADKGDYRYGTIEDIRNEIETSLRIHAREHGTPAWNKYIDWLRGDYCPKHAAFIEQRVMEIYQHGMDNLASAASSRESNSGTYAGTYEARTQEFSDALVPLRETRDLTARHLLSSALTQGGLGEGGGGIVLGTDESGSPALVNDWMLSRHALIFGGSGYGKTFCMYLMELAQLAGGNCSLVAIDAKMESVRRMRGMCHQAGLASDRVWTVAPTESGSAPGFNPLLLGDPADAAARMMDLLETAGAITGVRMRQFLRNALVAAAWHGLALSEVPMLLHDAQFRKRVLDSPLRWSSDGQYRRTREFLLNRLTKYKGADQDESALAVENKFDELLGNRLFLRMFEARENELDFASLFREPGAVLVCTGKGGGVTPAARALLTGVIVNALEAAAAERSGNVPVILAVDEAGVQSRTIAEPLSDVVNMARERGIRLLLATQHGQSLPDTLRTDLMESSAVKIYFRPGGDSARESARHLDSVPQVPVPGPYKGFLLARKRGGDDGIVPIEAAHLPPAGVLLVDPSDVGSALKRFCQYSSAEPPVFLSDGRLAREAFAAYPPGSVFLRWEDGYGKAEIDVPDPDWEARLRSLNAGEAIAVLGNEPARKIRIERVHPEADAPSWYGWKRREPDEMESEEESNDGSDGWEDDGSID